MATAPVLYTVTYLRHSMLDDTEKITENITQIQLARLLNSVTVTLLEARLCTEQEAGNA